MASESFSGPRNFLCSRTQSHSRHHEDIGMGSSVRTGMIDGFDNAFGSFFFVSSLLTLSRFFCALFVSSMLFILFFYLAGGNSDCLQFIIIEFLVLRPEMEFCPIAFQILFPSLVTDSTTYQHDVSVARRLRARLNDAKEKNISLVSSHVTDTEHRERRK